MLGALRGSLSIRLAAATVALRRHTVWLSGALALGYLPYEDFTIIST
jgi:hypothetical protein